MYDSSVLTSYFTLYDIDKDCNNNNLELDEEGKSSNGLELINITNVEDNGAVLNFLRLVATSDPKKAIKSSYGKRHTPQ